MDAQDPKLGALIDRVHRARSQRTPLEIRGGGTKAFYGGPARGEPLEVSGLAGISLYEPTELVVTVRAGTPLAELEAALAAHGQCLPFEPPRFNAGGTVGGMVAAGLSGPARANFGSVRDHVLGVTLLNGRGEVLTFGGQVAKNVAGYDVSRLVVGALGILGIICEVSLKVLPVPRAVATLCFECDERQALEQLKQWASQPLPLSASAWCEGRLRVRLAGAVAAVNAACVRLGGALLDPEEAQAWWLGLRDHRQEFFALDDGDLARGECLWRLSVPNTSPPAELPGTSDHRVARCRAMVAHRCGAPRSAVRRRIVGWPCHVGSRRRQVRRRIHSARRGAHAHSPRLEAGLRSGRHLQSRTLVRGALSGHANSTDRRVRSQSRGQGGPGHPAQVRALRLLQCDLSHLSIARRRTRRSSRANLPDQAGARGRRRHPQYPATFGPLPHLSELPNDLSERRRIWTPGRHRPQDCRCASGAPGSRANDPLGAQGGTHVEAVCAGDEVGAGVAPAVAGGIPEIYSAACGPHAGRPVLGVGASTAGADAARLCAALHDAEHRCRGRAGARCGGNRGGAIGGGRLLRRSADASRRSRGGPREHAPQYRRLDAHGRGGRGGGDRRIGQLPAASPSRNMDTRFPATRTMQRRRRASARWRGT